MTTTHILRYSSVVVRLALSAVLASLASCGTFLLHGRLSAYMQGVSLHELSEDFGGTFHAILISAAAFLLVLFLGMFFSRKFFNRFIRDDSNVDQ